MIPDTRTDADDESDRDAVFVEQFRLTGDPVAACVRAGIRDARYPITIVAQRQMQKPEIVAALKALSRIETNVAPIEVTRDSIIADMETVYQKALTDGQYASAISSKKLQSMLLGLLQQNINITHGFNPELMTTEQLMRIASAKDISKDVIEVEDD